MAANECDFTSSFFDPLKALYTAGLQPPVPNVHVFNNINEYAQSLKLGRIVQKGGKQEGNKLKGQDDGEGSLGQRLKNIAYSKPRSRNRDPKRLAHLMKVKSKTDGIEEKVAMLEKTKKKPQQKNVLQRMEDNYKQGPLSILYNCIEQRKQLRVWTRRLKSLRGVCVGYLVAFDKHMNLAMMDVDEMFAIEEEVEVDPMKMAERIEKKKKKKRTWRRRKRQLLRNRVLSDDVNSDVKNLESRSITGVGETGNHQREPNFYQDNVFQFSFRMAEPEDVAVKKFANDASNTFDYKNTPQLNDVCCHGSNEGKSESNKQSGEDNDRRDEELSIGERERSRHEDERRTNNDLAERIDVCTAVEEAHVIEERIHVDSLREEIGTAERNKAVLRLKDEVQHETVRTDINEVKPLVGESGHSQGKETTLSSERVKDEVKQNSLNKEEKVARSNEEERQVILFGRSCDNGDQGSKDKVEMNVEGGKATLSSEHVKDEVEQISLNEEEMVARSNEEDRHGILFGRSWDDGDQGSEDKAEMDVEDEKTTLDSEHTKYVVRQKMSNEEKVAVSNEEEKLDTRGKKGNHCDRDGKSKLDVKINVEVNEDDKKVEQQNSENENGERIFTKNESVASTRNTRADEKDETEMVSTCSETSTSEMAEIESKFIESVNIVLRTETETEMESTNKMCGELTTLNKGCISSFEEKLSYGGENKDENKNLSVYKLSSEPNVLTNGKNEQGNTGTSQDVQSTEQRHPGGEEETMGLEMNPQYLHEPCTSTENNEQTRLGMLSERRSYCQDRLGKPRMEITFSNVTDVEETKSKTIDSEDINSKRIDSESVGLSTDTQVNMKATHSGSTCTNLDDQRSSCEEGEIRSNEEDQDDNKNRSKQKANLEPSIPARDKTAHHIVNSTGKTTAENEVKREKEEGELSSSDDEGRVSSCEEGEIISSGEENEVEHRKKDLETFSDNKTKGIKYKEKMNKSQGEQGKQSKDSGRKYSGKLAKESGRKISVKRPKDSSREHSSNRAKDSGRENSGKRAKDSGEDSGNRTKNFDRENVRTRTKDSPKKDTGKRANYSGTLKGKDFSAKILESKSKVGSSKDVATSDMFSRRAEKGTIERKHRTQTSISSQGKARGSEDKLRYATKHEKSEEREQDRLRDKTEKQDSWTKETSRIRRSSLETKRNTNAKETDQKDSMTETSASSKARLTSTGKISQNKNVCKGGTKKDELKMSSSLIRTRHSSSEKIYYLTKETRRDSRGKSVHDEIQKEKVKNRAQGVSCDKREKDVPQHDATRKSTNARDGEKGSKADSRGTETGKGLTIANNLKSNTENTNQNETAKGRKRTSDPSSVKEEKRNDGRGDDLSKKDCKTKLGRKEETTNAHKKQSQIKEANEVQLPQASRTSVAGERRGIFCSSSSKKNKGSDKTKTELAKKHNLHGIEIKPGTEKNVKKPKARNSDVKHKCLQQRGGLNGSEEKVFERDRNVASRTEDGVERSFMSSYSSTKTSGFSISAITELEEKSRPSSKVDKPCSDNINAMQNGSSDTSSRRKSKTTDKVKQRQSENFQDLHTQTDTHGKEERRDGKQKSRPSLSKLGKSCGDGINNVSNRTDPSSSRKAVITEKRKSKQNGNFQDSRNQTDARGQERRGERKSCSSSSNLDKSCGGDSINDTPKRSDTSGSRKLRVTENVRLPSKTESFQDLSNKTDTRTNKGEKNGKNDKDKSVERKSNKGYTSAADSAFTRKNISRESMKSKQTKSIFSSSKENSRDRIKTSQKMKLSTSDSRKALKEAECTTQIHRNETHNKSNTKRLGTREKSSTTDEVKLLNNEPKVVREKGKNTEKKSVEKSNVKAKPAEKHLKKNSAKKVCSKRKKDTDAAEPPSKVRRVGKSFEKGERPVKTKEAKLPGNVVTVRVLKVERGKALVLKQRHVNQLFIRGDNVIMVAYENDQVKKIGRFRANDID